MLTKEVNGLRLLFFENLSHCNRLFHAVTTRVGGISPPPYDSLNLGLNTPDQTVNLNANHTLIGNALGFDIGCIVSARQVHGSVIETVTRIPETLSKTCPDHTFKNADGLITSLPGVTLLVRVADCVPMILYDPSGGVLAVVHAGWRGTLSGIAAAAFSRMVSVYGSSPSGILAGIGPSIGACCFSVGDDVADKFDRLLPGESLIVRQNKKGRHVDLRAANRHQLISAGCPDGNIKVSDYCTACCSDMFFSHRREQGKTGRFGLFAGLRF